MAKSKHDSESILTDVGVSLFIIIIVTLATYSYNLTETSLLPTSLPYILIFASVFFYIIFFIWKGFSNYKTGILLFAIFSAILLSTDYFQSTDLKPLLLSFDTGIIIVSGIVFALDEVKNPKNDGHQSLRYFLFIAIIFSFLSMSAAYANTPILAAGAVVGANLALYLLFLSIYLIMPDSQKKKTKDESGSNFLRTHRILNMK